MQMAPVLHSDAEIRQRLSPPDILDLLQEAKDSYDVEKCEALEFLLSRVARKNHAKYDMWADQISNLCDELRKAKVTGSTLNVFQAYSFPMVHQQ